MSTRPTRKIATVLALIAMVIVVFWRVYGKDSNREGWGDAARSFHLPLTYENFDPEDFGAFPDRKDAALLEKFRPKVYVAPGGLHPIDFYEDYLPRCILRDSLTDRVAVQKPTRKDLKRHERDYGFFLDYIGPEHLEGSPVAYGRVYRETTLLNAARGLMEVPFVFLKYNFLFLQSGLPAQLPWYKQLGARIIGDPARWHELDIHGAIIVVAVEVDKSLKPVGLLLAQHNHFRTYLFGRDRPYPKDGQVRVSFALRSNEPYPLPIGSEPDRYAAVGDPSDFSFVILGKGFFLTSGWDVVFGEQSGAAQIHYTIKQLPDKDPLYVSWIPLGEKKTILAGWGSFYRNGPPGIDLMTWPEVSAYAKILQFWYVDNRDENQAQLFERYFKDFSHPDFRPILKYNSRRFAEEFIKLHPELVK